MENNDELMHYGKLGMRWGRRKSKPSLEEQRQTALTTHKPKELKKNMHTLSDNELRSRINRIQMEQQVQGMAPTKLSKGRKLVGNMLGDIGKSLVKEFVKDQVKTEIKSGGKRIKAATKAASIVTKR